MKPLFCVKSTEKFYIIKNSKKSRNLFSLCSNVDNAAVVFFCSSFKSTDGNTSAIVFLMIINKMSNDKSAQSSNTPSIYSHNNVSQSKR